MAAGWMKKLTRARLVVAFIVLSVLLSPMGVRRTGDALQNALPLAALGCAVANGQAPEVLARFAGMWLAVHGTKAALGQATINLRPDGGDHGFPSAHTSAAAFGASSLVHDCVAGNPIVRGLLILTAGFVGGSRIEVRAHDLVQVMAGALTGWISDRALRRPSPLRTRVAAALIATRNRLMRMLKGPA